MPHSISATLVLAHKILHCLNTSLIGVLSVAGLPEKHLMAAVPSHWESEDETLGDCCRSRRGISRCQ